VIGLSGVGAVQRVDHPEDGENYVRFRYTGRMGGGSGTPTFHILDLHFYETGGVELINAATGDSLFVVGTPVLSPDGARFVVEASSIETCEGVNRLEVWRITGDKPVREWTIEPYDCTRDRGWWSTDLAWRTPDSISFVRNSVPADRPRRKRDELDTTRATLVRRAGSWTLEQRAP
jgi:hypothetical protein